MTLPKFVYWADRGKVYTTYQCEFTPSEAHNHLSEVSAQQCIKTWTNQRNVKGRKDKQDNKPKSGHPEDQRIN